MANVIGAINGLRLANEATAAGPGNVEGFIILWAFSLVVCLSIGMTIAHMLQPSTDSDEAPWIYGGIAVLATILATMGTLMIWMLKH